MIFCSMTTYITSTKPTKTDCLIIPVFEQANLPTIAKELDQQFGGTLRHIVVAKDFEGKKMQSAVMYTEDKDIPRLLFIGLGKKEECFMRRYKQVIGAATILAQGKKSTRISVIVPPDVIEVLGARDVGEDTVIAIETAAYAYDTHKQKDDRVAPLTAVELILPDAKVKRGIEAGLADGQIVADSVRFTRDLGNTPPSIMTPTLLANEAKKLTKISPKVKVTILGKEQAKKLSMGCFLGVAQGSDQEPKFIVVEYWGGKKTDKPTVLVGKGITFDSGGLSLKPGDYMIDMKYDMLGAATVLGSIRAAATLGLKKNIVAIAPACENMPSGKAYRPDDILIAMNGKSVLVENTDAEGRLILADALCYAAKYKPKEVIDFATLTGACLVALGNERSGLFTPEDSLAEKLFLASERAGEQLWRLPVGEEYSEAMKSEIADIKNLGGVGGPRFAGASTAAAFLQYFTLQPGSGQSYPWAHIDLSCSYYGGKGKPWIRYGANGFGVATMVEYLRK